MNAPALLTLTSRQREVFDALTRHHREHGVMPTYKELQAALGIASPFGIKGHLDALATKGWLTHGGWKARSIRLTPAALRTLRCVRAEGGRVLVRHAALGESLTAEEARERAAELLRAAEATKGVDSLEGRRNGD